MLVQGSVPELLQAAPFVTIAATPLEQAREVLAGIAGVRVAATDSGALRVECDPGRIADLNGRGAGRLPGVALVPGRLSLASSSST